MEVCKQSSSNAIYLWIWWWEKLANIPWVNGNNVDTYVHRDMPSMRCGGSTSVLDQISSIYCFSDCVQNIFNSPSRRCDTIVHVVTCTCSQFIVGRNRPISVQTLPLAWQDKRQLLWETRTPRHRDINNIEFMFLELRYM
jgi:hypothetical protein